MEDAQAAEVSPDGTPQTGLSLSGAAFADFDANQDSRVDRQEFASRLAQTGLYSEGDADNDGSLNEDEFSRGIHSIYDADESGLVEEPEYQQLDNDMGEQGHWDRKSPNISR